MFTYKVRDIKLHPNDQESLKKAVAVKLGIKESEIYGLEILRRSVDARKKEDIRIVFSVAVTLKRRLRGEQEAEDYKYKLPSKSNLSGRPLVVGAGPAGLCAAYVLAYAGARPILIERGLDVEQREKKVNTFFNTALLDTECNVQFGEGGAGTFSDGKLTTGIKK